MIRIVLADDHAFVRAGVEAVLGGSGIDVVASVENGSAALAAIAREDPDVAILDIRMPDMDGVAVLQAMRDRKDNRPVILLTAQLEDVALLDALRAKVDGIVFKDGAAGQLQDAIRSVAAGRTYIDPQVMERALNLAIEGPGANPLSVLTERERRIADAVAQGKRNREIAGELGSSEGAIKIHLHRIYEKLGIENRTELALLVIAQPRR
ncbi:MAG: response regulator transcription factor [Sphingomonadales bacterium]|nr:response regulator transcription factor [Sphingomonadales bacterium]MDE2569312.1 response regulator transcription factor [Sphingomonadales bacterium]